MSQHKGHRDFWETKVKPSWPVNKTWTTLDVCCLTPDWSVVLSAQLTLTLHSSPATGQLRPSLQKKLPCQHEICYRYGYDQPATFNLNKMHVSVQDTEVVPVDISCKFHVPLHSRYLGGGSARVLCAGVSLGSLESRALQVMWRIALLLMLQSLGRNVSLPLWVCGSFFTPKENCKKFLSVQRRFM